MSLIGSGWHCYGAGGLNTRLAVEVCWVAGVKDLRA